MQGVASLALIPAPPLLLELEVMYGALWTQVEMGGAATLVAQSRLIFWTSTAN